MAVALGKTLNLSGLPWQLSYRRVELFNPSLRLGSLNLKRVAEDTHARRPHSRGKWVWLM
jgi:hypothetical protein